MRLDKFLVEVGQGSRTEVKQLLKKKQVSVNGKIETSFEKVDQVICRGTNLSSVDKIRLFHA